jgi:Uma2 family endonuclease
VAARRNSAPDHSADDSLGRERRAESKGQYVNGSIYAMAGGSLAHHRITANRHRLIAHALHQPPCEVFTSDMTVRIDRATCFRYPDASGLGGPIELHDALGDAYCNPPCITEVLSPSTEALDRGEKFHLDRFLDSLREYVLVRRDRVEVELFRKEDDGRWNSVPYNELSDGFDLRPAGVRLSPDPIYERVIPPAPAP